MLRILLCIWEHEGGAPLAGETYEKQNFLPALKALGHEVELFDLGMTTAVGPATTGSRLEEAVRRVEPDLVFTSLVGDDVDMPSLRRISALPTTTTFNWFADDHWRFDGFSSRWAPCFNWVSTTDELSLPKYESLGYDSVLLTQWAASPLYRPAGVPLARDVSFVGQVYGDRARVVAGLRRAGTPVETWGAGWRTRPVHKVARRLPFVRDHGGRAWAESVRASTRASLAEMVQIFESSRVNLNLADGSHGDRQQIKGRVFEVPACGGFLLTQDAQALDRFFVPGEEVAVFQRVEELPEMIRYWLDHEDHRARVASAGLARVRREHTYEHRFTDLFRAMGLSSDGGTGAPAG